MTTEEYTSIRVTKINRELSHEEQRLPGLEREVTECRERIATLKNERQEELNYEAREG